MVQPMAQNGAAESWDGEANAAVVARQSAEGSGTAGKTTLLADGGGLYLRSGPTAS